MLPNLIVIGGMKCGTSALHYYLSLHPDVFMSRKKELCFFAEHWDRGLAWYETQFPEAASIRGESSPNYAKYPAFDGVPERIASVVPDAKLLYLVRDPVSRIVSHYIDSYSWGRESRSIDEALADPRDNHYVNVSRYGLQVERYLGVFPREQMLVITAEELRERRRETLAQIFRFLGVDSSFDSPGFDAVLNTAGERRRKNALGHALARAAGRLDPSALAVTVEVPRRGRLLRSYVRMTSRAVPRAALGDRTRVELTRFLRDDVDKLTELTGREFEHWSVYDGAAALAAR